MPYDDLATFLRRPGTAEYQVDEVRECVCRSCGGRAFEIAVMEVASGARRACLGCGTEEYIADSAAYWGDDADVDYFCSCPCGHEEFSAAVAFSLLPGSVPREVRWVSIGLRCLSCGLPGVYEHWKVTSPSPTGHLVDRA